MQLRYYISVVETLSFTRAAEMNMIAQPAISYSIKMLEEELGGKLLDRTTRSVSLTPAGEWFYWEAKKLLRQMEAAKEYVRQISNDKYILRIGYSSLADLGMLSEIMKRFNSAYPNVTLRLIRQDMSLKLFNSLSEGEIDIAYCFDLTLDGRTDIKYRVLGRGSNYVILPQDHPLASRESLTSEDIASETLLIFQEHPPEDKRDFFPCKNTMAVPDIESMEMLISARLGISVLPITNTQKFNKLKLVKLVNTPEDENGETEVDLLLAWSDNSSSPVVKMFVDFLDKRGVGS